MTVRQYAFALSLTIFLTSCASERVPLTETKPVAPVLRPVVKAAHPAWAGKLATGSFTCEQGARIEIKTDADHNMSLSWKGSTYPMTPVSTSTGALRFENQGNGLVWIQIPSKSMLLNSKFGQQLANNCKVL